VNKFQEDLEFERKLTRPYKTTILENFFDAKKVIWTDGNRYAKELNINCFVVLENDRRIAVSCKSHRPAQWKYRTEITQEYYTQTRRDKNLQGPWFEGIANVHLELYLSDDYIEWWLVDTLKLKTMEGIPWQYKENREHGTATFHHVNGEELDRLGCILEHGNLCIARKEAAIQLSLL
jgi:hypothetical protein